MKSDFLQQWHRFLKTVGPDSRFRYAPTPSGFLHLGNAFNFIFNYLSAHIVSPAAEIVLRIDDLDAARKRPDYLEDIFETLNWLGLPWTVGPLDAEDFESKWSQKNRFAQYEAALNQLKDTGLVYACAKSRKDLEPFGGTYPPEFRHQGLSFELPNVAWRIATPIGFPLPDFVIRRRDGVPAYQLASLVDDRIFKITHLIRGKDLAASTAAQNYLAQLLGWQSLADRQVLHHDLLLDDLGGKLSKSAGAASLKAKYRIGEGPEPVFRAFSSWIGWEEHDLEGIKKKLLYGLEGEKQ